MPLSSSLANLLVSLEHASPMPASRPLHTLPLPRQSLPSSLLGSLAHSCEIFCSDATLSGPSIDPGTPSPGSLMPLRLPFSVPSASPYQSACCAPCPGARAGPLPTPPPTHLGGAQAAWQPSQALPFPVFEVHVPPCTQISTCTHIPHSITLLHTESIGELKTGGEVTFSRYLCT